MSAPDARLERLETLLDRLRTLDLTEAGEVLRQAQRPHDAAELLEVYLNEARVGLRLVEPYLVPVPGRRILEVGAGAGVLTAFLQSEGFEVVGIEPGGGGGFGFMPALQRAVAEELDPDERPSILPLAAEQLDREEHGLFDLIFSVNVLEHVMALDEAMAALAGVLAPGGRMIHTCPNYAFPYEPHLAIPLVPGAPKLTRFVLPGAVRRQRSVWDTVNFITARRLRGVAARAGLVCELEPGVAARSFARLAEDPIFRRRHEGLVATVAGTPILGRLALAALCALPPGLATPMVARIAHRNQPGRGRQSR